MDVEENDDGGENNGNTECGNDITIELNCIIPGKMEILGTRTIVQGGRTDCPRVPER